MRVRILPPSPNNATLPELVTALAANEVFTGSSPVRCSNFPHDSREAVVRRGEEAVNPDLDGMSWPERAEAE